MVIRALLCAALAAALHAQPIVIEGSVAPGDASSYRLLPFAVPAGTHRVSVELVTDQRLPISLGIFDPLLFRGMGRQSFTIGEYDATAPYSPGPIVPGAWNVMLAIGHIAAPAKFAVKVTLSTATDQPNPLVIRAGAGWYKGDLHSHTGHSDGLCYSQSGRNIPCPAHRLIEAAAARSLDFLAVTDHNTASTLNQLREMQPYFDRLLLIHGREITTMNGHTNVWGTAAWLDFRIGFQGWTVNNFLDQVHASGGVMSINHAYWPTGPGCPGCGWGWKPQTDFSKVDAIEALNGYAEKGGYFTPPAGLTGIPFWEEQVARGYHPTAVGGGDDHRAGEQIPLGIGVGSPTTVVYARELSEPAILEGIRRGHVVIQRRGPDGPLVMLTAGDSIPGDVIKATAKPIAFTLRSERCGDCKTVLYVDGKAQPSAPANGTIELTFDGKRHWVRVELIDAAGEVAAMTNPIYVNEVR